MDKFFQYMKYIALFMILIFFITCFISLINLTNINSKTISKIGVIISALSFFFISAKAASSFKEKGYILGIKLGFIFIMFLILINLFIFKSPLSIDRLIYYIILIASSILGGSFGKNIHIKLKK